MKIIKIISIYGTLNVIYKKDKNSIIFLILDYGITKFFVVDAR